KQEAFQNRCVSHDPAEDGMGYLSVYHSADVTCSIMAQATARARALRAAGDERTIRQIEADLIVEAGITGILTTSNTGTVGSENTNDNAVNGTVHDAAGDDVNGAETNGIGDAADRIGIEVTSEATGGVMGGQSVAGVNTENSIGR